MARLHNGFDIYLGDDLAYPLAMIVEDLAHGSLKIRTRSGGVWSDALVFTGVTLVSGRGNTWVWNGTNPDDESVRVTAVRRAPAPCSSCGGR